MDKSVIVLNKINAAKFKLLSSTAILLILFCSNISLSQNLVSLYKEFIPASILNNNVYRNSVDTKLKLVAEIDPELIYYNILLLKNLSNDSSKINQPEMNNYVYQLKKNYLIKRCEWAENQITKINESPEINIVKEKAKEYLENFVIDSSSIKYESVKLFKTDSNFRDYLVVLYLTRNKSLKYNQNENYKKVRLNYEYSLIKQYEGTNNINDNSNSFNSEIIINNIIHYWYIFAQLKNERDNKQQIQDAYQIIERIIKQEYSTNKRSNFTINIGYCFNNSTFTLNNDLPVSFIKLPSYSPQPQNYSDPVAKININTQQYILSLGYRIFLKDYMTFLSYIKAQIILSYSADKKGYSFESQKNGNDIVSDIRVSENENLNWESTISEMNTYTLKISVPLFVMGKSLFFETSLNAGILHLSSSTIYNYSMYKSESYTAGSFWNPYTYSHEIASGNGKGNLKEAKNYFIIFPTVDFSYETNSRISFGASGSYNYLAVTCGYSF